MRPMCLSVYRDEADVNAAALDTPSCYLLDLHEWVLRGSDASLPTH